MCGIIGQFNKVKKIETSIFNTLRDTLIHRGPDGAGTQILNKEKGALGHRRLSIIDLSDSGKQPMCNEDQSIWLTFNGEIYNYKSLQVELKQNGHIFKSTTDSEVLIHGYEEWGMEGLLKRIKGMFAFGIWDEKIKKLFLGRDRFGIKPLHYFINQDTFIFSSELKAIIKDKSIKQTLNWDAIGEYLIYGYIPSPNSIWVAIKKLSPAHYLVFDSVKFTYNIKKYWQLTTKEKVYDESLLIEKTDYLIQKSVKEHLESDVPIGLFLSGGYDSSALLMYLRNQNYEVNSFTLGFHDSHKTEHRDAAMISDVLGSQHFEKIINEKDVFDLELAYFFDEPYGISSQASYFHISKLAAQFNKVVFAGDGGDELFGGYKWHYYLERLFNSKDIFSSLKFQAYSFFSTGLKNKMIERNYHQFVSQQKKPRTQLLKILNPDFQKYLPVDFTFTYQNRIHHSKGVVKPIQLIDYFTFLPEACLTRADRASMAHSLEVRVPFLDHELFEFIFSLKENTYFKRDVKKFLLYENLKQNLPSKFLDLPKKGFSTPLSSIKKSIPVKNAILKGKLVELGIINGVAFEKLYEQLDNLNIYLFYNLEKWLKRWY